MYGEQWRHLFRRISSIVSVTSSPRARALDSLRVPPTPAPPPNEWPQTPDPRATPVFSPGPPTAVVSSRSAFVRIQSRFPGSPFSKFWTITRFFDSSPVISNNNGRARKRGFGVVHRAVVRSVGDSQTLPNKRCTHTYIHMYTYIPGNRNTGGGAYVRDRLP